MATITTMEMRTCLHNWLARTYQKPTVQSTLEMPTLQDVLDSETAQGHQYWKFLSLNHVDSWYVSALLLFHSCVTTRQQCYYTAVGCYRKDMTVPLPRLSVALPVDKL